MGSTEQVTEAELAAALKKASVDIGNVREAANEAAKNPALDIERSERDGMRTWRPKARLSGIVAE